MPPHPLDQFLRGQISWTEEERFLMEDPDYESTYAASNDLDSEANYCPQDNKHKWQYCNAVAMNPGREPIRIQEEVTIEMREELRDLLRQPKETHLKGSGQDTAVTLPDVRRLVKAAFADGWISGAPHQMCGDGYAQPNVNDVAAQVGLFDENNNANTTNAIQAQPAQGYNYRGVRGKITAAEAPHTTARNALQPIYIGCLESMVAGNATFAYYDSAHRILPQTARHSITLHSAYDKLGQAKALSMQYHDKFMMNRAREYNLRAAIYLARNRLTHWANGNPLNTRPVREDMGIYVDYVLMRNLSYCIPSVLDMCKQLSVPGLWDDMKRLF
ncbi:hypothetical protein Daus18300_010278 [Diaporthe australafricana]|uniref:Uncharacterized protein n=1 Tax=Diaporthe australafricana TaxID=127596 RepID=A0ABR3WBI1_9PEZI